MSPPPNFSPPKKKTLKLHPWWYRPNFEFLAKYLIHSLDSGDFSVSTKKKLTQKNQIIMAFGSTFLKKCTQI